MKLLLGGSPCTYWSVAQNTEKRETKAEGLGWELFKNYLIARDKFQPDYFLYENNASMSNDIKEQITKELGVNPILINSSFFSAQNRQRLYWLGVRCEDGNYKEIKVANKNGCNIMLKDIVDLDANYSNETVSESLSEEYYKGGFDGNLIGMIVNKSVCRNGKQPSQQYRVYSCESKSVCVDCDPRKHYMVPTENKLKYSYEVKNKTIKIGGKEYPINLSDGFYIIRKLSLLECMRLQTIPEFYKFPTTNRQANKMLGNGWTVDVISHLLSHCGGILKENLDVLSMYDGMSCGRIALNKIGASIERYRATEIDKHAINTAQHNFPNTIQLGDAFQVRNDDWR